MTQFEQYLISTGYKQYRNGHPAKEIDYRFSTMEPGGCTYEYLKEGSVTVIFGLNEWKKPPTFCSPRMKLSLHNLISEDFSEDDIVNQMLKEHTPEEFYKKIC